LTYLAPRPLGDVKPVPDVAVLDLGGARRGHPPAAVVAAHHDVGHPQVLDRELDDCGHIDVVVGHDVGDVAMDEQLARPAVQDLLRRHPGVRATDPEQMGLLAGQLPAEELWVGGELRRGPGPIPLQQVFQAHSHPR
jgi:hypothetical protein